MDKHMITMSDTPDTPDTTSQSINRLLHTEWNLPQYIINNCDIYYLTEYTWEELAQIILSKSDLGVNPRVRVYGICLDSKYFTVVWHNEALAAYLYPSTFLPTKVSFYVSYRKYADKAYAIIQRKRK